MSELSDNIWEFVEELVKSQCVRCSNQVPGGTKGSRCKSCMDKLTKLRHKAGTPERAWRKADDATRRQKGKNGTAPGTSKGNGKWSDIAKKHQKAEKKAGQKLSPDRKDNDKGYSDNNTRAIPEHLNRGRHNADEKKIKEWKKKLKKNNITEDEFAALLFIKAELHGLNLEDLTKGAPVLNQMNSSLADHVGTEHELELHPDMDNLYRIKNTIANSGKPTMKKSNIQKLGFNPNLIEKLPHDGKGNVSVGDVEDHIHYLPKSKVIASVEPYALGMQQHRPGQQHAITVKLHPDEKSQFDNKTNSLIEAISPHQHKLHDKHEVLNQIGWSRIDDSAPGHWHVDEIQSDMQNTDKIKKMANTRTKHIDLNDDDIDKVHSALSGNHEDPQHLIHSAVNALGRKLNVNSTSMDMPEDQAKQSRLDQRIQTDFRLWPDDHPDVDFEIGEKWREDAEKHYADSLSKEKWDNAAQNHPNQYLRSALQKLDRSEIADRISATGSEPTESFEAAMEREDESGWDNTREAWKKLSEPERDSFIQHLIDIERERPEDDPEENPIYQEYLRQPPPPGYMHIDQERFPHEEYKQEKSKLPVHQIDTYDKRPRKLGMKPIDKASVLGEHPTDKAKQIQYSELYKNLKEILERLRK